MRPAAHDLIDFLPEFVLTIFVAPKLGEYSFWNGNGCNILENSLSSQTVTPASADLIVTTVESIVLVCSTFFCSPKNHVLISNGNSKLTLEGNTYFLRSSGQLEVVGIGDEVDVIWAAVIWAAVTWAAATWAAVTWAAMIPVEAKRSEGESVV